MMLPEPDAARDPFNATIPGVLSANYEIVRELGRGGAATVFLARDVRHGRTVAVKVVAPDAVAAGGNERFLHEIRTAARLTHPHILGVHDSGRSGDVLFYVMPYVEGETLRARLLRDGAVGLSDAIRLIRELADALAYAHAHGVLHRDLKPENVLLSGGHAVIADFGIAKAIAAATDSGARAPGMTVTGMALGTPAYMAPEQAVGDRNIDHRADLYALGVVAYEVLSGVHPFGSRSPQALVAAHLTEAPTPLHDRRPEVPAALGRLVMQLLAKDPAARPRDAATVVRTLDALMTSAMPVLPISGRSRRGTRRTTMVLATVLVVAAGYIAWRRSGSGDASSAAPIGTLAVLPFENTGSDANDEYFSSGITDELAHALAQLPGLRIAGRTSTYALKGRNLSAQEIGRALDVAAIISGTVQRAGDRLRVTTQLVSTRDGKVLWDSVYESRSRDVFAVQDEFTRAVAATLSRSLGDRPAVATPVGVARGTSSEEAYDLFLKGQFFYMSRGQANVAQSIAYFQKAIAVDPRFARAHAALANAYAVLRVYAPDPRDSLALLARASANRAMALDSTLAMSQAAMAQSQMTSLQFDSSEVHFRRALALDPTSGETHLAFGFQQLATGHTDVAIREFQEAVRLDPLVKSAHSALAMALVFARRFPEAIAESRRLVAVDSTFPLSYLPLALAQAAGGHGDSAVVTLERSAPYNRTAPQRRAFLMFAYAAAGRWTDVARMRVELSAMGAAAPAADRAFADLLLGDPEPIVRLLSTEKGRREWATVNWFGCSPLLDPLWHDARFRATMDALHVEPCALARPWPFDRHAPGRS